MSAKTKIVIIRKRELIFAGVLLLAAIGLILLLVSHFTGKETSATSVETAKYIPGVYSSTVMLGGTAMDVEVEVDENHINSISIVNLDETVETMYPLVKPAMEELSAQIISSQSVEQVTYPQNNQYTTMVLHSAIKSALAKGSR